jgi:pyridinium-3,5-biscarboxylic acid mononucleotide synthase
MDEQTLRDLLEEVKRSDVGVDEALQVLRKLPFQNLDFARVDSHRALRTGFPEVILCSGKRLEHIVEIMARLATENRSVLATRASGEVFEAVRVAVPGVRYNELGRTIVYEPAPLPKRPGRILVVTAGTADIPVAEEAAVTADVMGNHVDRLYDVGVSGLHRLLSQIDLIQKAAVLIVVAGMEGALPSVVGGLVMRPVIAVPTSVGYGASFGGLAALLGMLNSCAAGVTVVNIDNGFGAGYAASLINRQMEVGAHVHPESRVDGKG